MSYQTAALGALVKVTASTSDTLFCTAVQSEGGAQKLDTGARTLGTTALAPSCAVLERDGDYVYSLEGVQGQASYDFSAIDWTTAIASTHVGYAHTNTAGEVDVLLLDDVTGNGYTYGKLTIYSGKDGINLGSSSMTAYNTAATVRNSGGTSSKYLCAFTSSGTYVGVALGSSESNYTRVSAVRTLTRLTVAQSGFFEENGAWYAVSGGAEYPIPDSVQIQISGTDTWAKGADALVTLLSGDYSFTACCDGAPSNGGRIRIIVVS